MSRRQRLGTPSQDHGCRGTRNRNKDLWGKRPMSGSPQSSYNKLLCRRKERKASSKDLRKLGEL